MNVTMLLPNSNIKINESGINNNYRQKCNVSCVAGACQNISLRAQYFNTSWTYITTKTKGLINSADNYSCGSISASVPIWWNSSYKYRKRVNITIISGSALPNGYTLNATVNTSLLVSQSKLKPDCSDLRVVFWNATHNVQLDRLNITRCNSGKTVILFKTKAAIASYDKNYFIYYGNNNAGAPPQNKSRVYAFYDELPNLNQWTIRGGDETYVTLNSSFGNPSPSIEQDPSGLTYGDTRIRSNNFTIANFTADYDIFLGSVGRSIHQFFLRSSGFAFTNGYAFRAQTVDADGGWYALSAGGWSAISGGVHAAVSAGAWHHIKLKVLGSNLSAWVDSDTAVTSVSSITTTAPGYVGSHLHGTTGWTLAHTDSVKITSLVRNAPHVNISSEEQPPLACNYTFIVTSGASSGGNKWPVRCVVVSSNAGTSYSRQFNVTVNDHPAAKITKPLNGSWISGIARLNASASSDDLGLSLFYFFLDNNPTFSSPTQVCQTQDKNCSLNTISQSECTDSVMGCYIRLNVTDSDGLKNSTFVELGIDNTGPSLTLRRPLNFSNITGTSYVVNASVSDSGSGVDTVKFLYRENKSVIWKFACSDTDHTSPYQCTWNIAAIRDGNKLMVRAVANDSLGNRRNDTAYNITLDRKGPIVALRSPKNNTWNLSNVIFIYNVTDTLSPIRNCSLIINGTLNQTSSNVQKNKNLNFTLTLHDGSWRWRINCTDSLGNKNSSAQWLVKIDSTPPLTTLTKPLDFANISGTAYTVSATVTDSGIGVNTTTFQYRVNNSDAWKLACVDKDGSPYQCQWAISGLPNSKAYEVRARANDTLGNLGLWDTNTNITLDRLAPNVTLISPPNMTRYLYGNVTFEYYVADNYNVKNCTLILNNKRNATNNTVIKDVDMHFDLYNLANKKWMWTVNCTDYSGNTGTTKAWNITVAPDTDPPIVFLRFPPPGTFDSDGTLDLKYNVSDNLSAIKNCTLLLNGTVNQTAPNPAENTELTFTVTSLSHGFWNWSVRCIDTAPAANKGTSKTWNFTVQFLSKINVTVLTNKPKYEIGELAAITTNTTDSYSSALNTTVVLDLIQSRLNTSLPWWNVSWKMRKPVLLNETAGSSKVNAIVEINFTKLGGNITKCYQLRVINNQTLSFTLIDTQLLDGNNQTYCRVAFRANVSANAKNQNNYFAYYNNSAAPQPSAYNAYYQEQIFYDNFESAGVCTGWNRPGTGPDWTEDSGINCYGSSGYCAYTFGDAEFHNLTNTTNLAAYRDCILTYRYKYNLFEAADTWYVQYRNTASTATLRTYADGGDDNAWHSGQANLSPNGLSATSTIIFREAMNQAADYLWIDDVAINCIRKSNLSIKYSVGPPQTHFNRTTNDTSADGMWVLVWSSGGKKFGNYSAVAKASRTSYTSRADLARFEITADKTPPRIKLVSPLNGTHLNYSNVMFYYIPNDDASPILNCSLILNGKLNKTNKTILRGIQQNFSLVLPDRKYNWTVNCTDSAGNVGTNKSIRQLWVDTKKPTIALLAPANGYNSSTTKLVFNFTAKDNLDANLTCNLTIDKAVSQSNFGAKNGSVTNRTVTGLGYGGHTWNVTCWDDSKNKNTSATRSFVVDNRLPVVLLNLPAHRQWKNTSTLFFNYSVIDDYPRMCQLWANFSGAWKKNETDSDPVNKTKKAVGPIILSDGYYKWNFNCSDYAGNSAFNSTNFSVQIDTKMPFIAFNNGTLRNNSYTSQDYIFVNITARDANEANITFYLYNQTRLINTTTKPAGTRSINFTKLNPNRVYRYNVSITDKAGNKNHTPLRIITLDAVPPYIAFGKNTLPNNSFSNKNYVFVNVTVSDFNEKNITFYLYNATHLINTTTKPAGSRTMNFTKLTSNKVYFYNVSVVDKANNKNHTPTRKITLDNIPPYVAFGKNTLPNNTYSSRNYISVNVSAYDLNEKNITFYLYNATKLVNATTLPAGSRKMNFTNLNSNKVYFYNVTVVDKASNKNSTPTWKITLDSVKPSVLLNSPANGTGTSNRSVKFKYTPKDTNLDTCILYHNSSGWKPNASFYHAQSGVQYSVTLNLSDGSYKWNVWCNDSAGNYAFNSTNRTFTVDTISPKIWFVLPTKPTNYNQSSRTLIINVSHVELHPKYIILYLNGTKNISKLYSGSYTNFTLSSLRDGFYTYYVWINDTSSNHNQTETRTIRIDTTPPSINLVNPKNNSWRDNASSNVLFQYNVTDALLQIANCSLIINSSRNQTNKTVQKQALQHFRQILSSGYYTWRINCSDTVGNKNKSVLRWLKVDRTFPAVSNPNVNATRVNITNYICLNLTVSDTFSGVSKAWAHVKQPNGFFIDIYLSDSQTTSCDKANGNGVWSARYRVDQQGLYNWTLAYANDTAGNLNVTIALKKWNVTSVGSITVNMTAPRLNFRINESERSRNYTYRQTCSAYCNPSPESCLNVTLFAVYNFSGVAKITKSSTGLINRENNFSCGNLNYPQWWNTSYPYRMPINLSVGPGKSLPENYTVNMSINTALLVSQGKMLRNCSDLRIVYWNGIDNVQLDRINQSACNRSATKIIFRLQRGFSGQSTDYFVYYGNRSVRAPPQNRSKVYAFYEEFPSLGKWTVRGGDESYITINNTFGSPSPSLEHDPTAQTNGDGRIRTTGFTMSNMTIEYDVYLGTAGRTIHQYFFRSSGFAFTDGYAWRLQNSGGDGGWFRLSGGSWTAIGTTYADVTAGAWHHVRLRALGSNLSAWIDSGSAANSVIDTTTSSPGYMGVHLHGTGGWNLAHTDNVVVQPATANKVIVGVKTEQNSSTQICAHTFNITTSLYSGGNSWRVWCLAESQNLGSFSSKQQVSSYVNDHPAARFKYPTNGSWLSGMERLNASSSTDDAPISSYSFAIDNNSAFASPAGLCMSSNASCTLNTVSQTQCDQEGKSCFLRINVTDSDGLKNFSLITVGIDNRPPRINLLSPKNNSLTSSNIRFTYKPTDTNLDTCVLYHNALVWKANLTNRTMSSGQQSSFTLNLGDGFYKWNVWCNDTKGHYAFNNTNYTVRVDSKPPVINLIGPKNGTWRNQNVTVYYNVSDTVSNISNCSIIVDNKLNATTQNPEQNVTLEFIVTRLSQGNHYWRINCTDLPGNTNSSKTWLVKIDTTGPSAVLDRPRNFTNISSNSYKLNATITDAGVGLIGVVTFQYRNSSSAAWSKACADSDGTSPFNCTWDLATAPDGNQYYVRVFANDSVGNLGSSSMNRNITIDRLPPFVRLLSPPNNYRDIDGNLILYYNVTDRTSRVKNCSLILNNKINMTNRTVTKGITQHFTFNGLREASYNWSVNCSDYARNKNSSQTRNFTVAYDREPPVVQLVSPANRSTYTSDTVVFYYNVTDALSGIKNCSLIINKKLNQSQKTVVPGMQSFTQSLSDGKYTWSVNCTDNSTGFYNRGSGGTFNLTVLKTTSLVVTVYGERTSYEVGERIKFTTNTTSKYNTPVATNLTISIINGSASKPWWNTSFKYRKRINITNNASQTLLPNSTINYTINTQALIGKSRMRSDGNDLRIVWFNNETNQWYELNRLAYRVNTTSTTIVFRIQRNITAGRSDYNYYLYYGNGSITSAPQAKSGVYFFYDNFDTNTLDSYNKMPAFSDASEDTNDIFSYNASRKWINVKSNASKGKSLRKAIPSIRDAVIEVDQYFDDNRGVYAKLELAARIYGNSYYTFFASTNILNSLLLRYNSTGHSTQLASSGLTFGKKDVWRHLRFVVYSNSTAVFLKAYVNQTQLFDYVDSSSNRLAFAGGFGMGEYQLIGRFDNLTVTRYLARNPLTATGTEERLVFSTVNSTGFLGTSSFRWNSINQSYSNYTIVSLATNPNYINGYGYYRFRLGPDITPPSITLVIPVNGFNSTNTSLLFAWLAYDRVDTNISCNLTLNGATRATVPSIAGVQTNYTLSNLAEGHNRWNLTCIDDSNNTNRSATRMFVIVMAPKQFTANLAADNRSVRLNWSNVSYAKYYAIYIGKNYTYFYSTPNATVTALNWTDLGSAGVITRFYRIATVRGSAKKFHNNTVGKHLIVLYPDWNMISLPLALNNARLKTVSSGGYDPPVKPHGCVVEIWRYNSTRSNLWEETLYESNHWNPASGSGNFTRLDPLAGYWFYNNLTQNCNYTLVGTLPARNSTVRLNQDYNLVAWHSEDSASLPKSCNLAYPLQVAPYNSIKYIYYYNTTMDNFKGNMHMEYSGCSNNDWGWPWSSSMKNVLGLEPTKGYYLKTIQISNWTLRSLK
jgi:hypothetical protein